MLLQCALHKPIPKSSAERATRLGPGAPAPPPRATSSPLSLVAWLASKEGLLQVSLLHGRQDQDQPGQLLATFNGFQSCFTDLPTPTAEKASEQQHCPDSPPRGARTWLPELLAPRRQALPPSEAPGGGGGVPASPRGWLACRWDPLRLAAVAKLISIISTEVPIAPQVQLQGESRGET